MSALCLVSGNDTLLSLLGNTGLSDEAKVIHDRYGGTISYLYKNQTWGEPFYHGIQKLSEVAQDASTPNWDGYGALPVDDLAYLRAVRFLRALTRIVPPPEIGVDPDGEVSFEWYNGRNNIFSVSISGDGTLTYAGIFGSSKVHGIEYFEDRIPRVIIMNMQRLWKEELNY